MTDENESKPALCPFCGKETVLMFEGDDETKTCFCDYVEGCISIKGDIWCHKRIAELERQAMADMKEATELSAKVKQYKEQYDEVARRCMWADNEEVKEKLK